MSLRWFDQQSGTFCSKSTSQTCKGKAEQLRQKLFNELNGLVSQGQVEDLIAAAVAPAEPEPVEEVPPASWEQCKAELSRHMTAKNKREGYIESALLVFDGLRRMFPAARGPADVTVSMANEWQVRRAIDDKVSPWTIRSQLATLKAIYSKWLGRKGAGLVESNPFADVDPPTCDAPEVRIVTWVETKALLDWMNARWLNWKLPGVYLSVAALLGWRATEIASIRESDILPDGFVHVTAGASKTRKQKIGRLPVTLHKALQECVAGGWAFGRFSDDLSRRLMLKRQPQHAARVAEFAPERLVGWLQDELQRFHESNEAEAEKAGLPKAERFTLHDFRRTAITGMQMAGGSEKEVGLMVGVTPEVARVHYDRLDQKVIAKRITERWLAHDAGGSEILAHALRTGS